VETALPEPNLPVKEGVLSQLLSSLTIMSALPTVDGLCEFAVRALAGIPGIERCGICVRDATRPVGEVFPAWCEPCRDERAAESLELSIDCRLKHQAGLWVVPVSSERNAHGVIVLEATPACVSEYGPHVVNYALILATELDNRWRKRQLEDKNRTLAEQHERLNREMAERNRSEEAVRTSLAEKDVLLRELYHRTKNNMQVIVGMLDLFRERMPEPLLLELKSKIQGMALVHQKLYQSNSLSSIDLGEYLGELAHLVLRTYRVPVTRVGLTLGLGAGVNVLIDTAIPCGLVMNELITNALKHAFPPGRRGTIAVSLARLGDGDIELSVRDDGVGLTSGIDVRRAPSLGLQTVFGIGEGQMQGRVRYESSPRGTQCRLRFRDDLYRPRV
jgi:two-component sensor histidine kinase